MVGTGLFPGTRCKTLKLLLVGKTNSSKAVVPLSGQIGKHREAFSLPLCYFSLLRDLGKKQYIQYSFGVMAFYGWQILTP